jgi:hypothetical protein
MPKTVQSAAPPDMPASALGEFAGVMARRSCLPTLLRNTGGCGKVPSTAIFLVNGTRQLLKRSVPCSNVVKSLQG